jgi:hypothetical protein
MHSHIIRGLAVIALVTIVPLAASADAISDQKKAYEKLGIKVPHPPAMCNLLSGSEAARAIGKPVKERTYRPIAGLGEKAYVANEMSIGYEAVVLSTNGITQVMVAGSKTPDAALALVRIAMKR